MSHFDYPVKNRRGKPSTYNKINAQRDLYKWLGSSPYNTPDQKDLRRWQLSMGWRPRDNYRHTADETLTWMPNTSAPKEIMLRNQYIKSIKNRLTTHDRMTVSDVYDEWWEREKTKARTLAAERLHNELVQLYGPTKRRRQSAPNDNFVNLLED